MVVRRHRADVLEIETEDGESRLIPTRWTALAAVAQEGRAVLTPERAQALAAWVAARRPKVPPEGKS